MRTRANSIIGDRPAGRPVGDYYPTPDGATNALINHPDCLFRSNQVWEPACGDGAISKILTARGYHVKSSDLYDRGYGDPGVDFLFNWDPWEGVIMTNPPFNLAEQFLEHALILGSRQVFLLLKLQFLEGARRSLQLESSPLARVYVFRKRLTMTRNGEKQTGSGMMAFAWFEWVRGWKENPMIRWL